jgi:hypothetical protein
MRDWFFPFTIFVFVTATLALIYFNPRLFGSPRLISPLVDITTVVSPTDNPLAHISTPKPAPVSPTPPPAPTEAEKRSGVTSITLTAQKTASDSAHLVWTIDGTAAEGFVILSSSQTAPTYPTRPQDQARSSYDPSARDFTLSGLTGTVYLRVCEFTENACGVYSNQITLDF